MKKLLWLQQEIVVIEKKSCTLGKSGDKIREISCRFIGEEECVEKTHTKCLMKKNKRKL